MIHRFALPDLGEGIAEGEVLQWLVQPGETVAADEPIAEVSTDKVDVVIPSPVAGVVKTLCVEVGRVVSVGTVLAEIITEPDGATSRTVRQAPAKLEIDLDRAPAHASSRQTIARRLSETSAVPMVTTVDEADFEAVRSASEPPLVAVARAAVIALREHRELNAWGSVDGTRYEHEHVHLGVATQTPTGLVVPVVRDADVLRQHELAQAIASVTLAARERRARPDDLGGSTFTITSAGAVSGLFATPLLNLPEVAILGLYRIQPRPVIRDGAIVARHVAHLSVTFDHRAVDGISVATFLRRVVALIESWPVDPTSGEQAT